MAAAPRQPLSADEARGRQTGGEPADAPDQGYPQLPEEHPGLIGGPATEAVPRADQPLDEELQKQRQRSLVAPLPGEENDGGESVLSSRPREVGGERPPKPR